MVATGEVLEYDATGHQRFAPRVLIQGDQYTVGTTGGDETVTSASFTADDVGRGVSGFNIPLATTIASVIPGVSAELSAPANDTGTTTLFLDPGPIGPGNLWLQPFEDPDNPGPTMGVLRTRNGSDDGWQATALAAITTDGNVLSVSVSDSGTASIYARRSDLTYLGQITLSAGGGLNVKTSDDNMTITLEASDTDGSDVARIVLSPTTGVAVTTNPGTFTYNGNEVSTV